MSADLGLLSAHRLRSIIDYDRIICLGAGKLVRLASRPTVRSKLTSLLYVQLEFDTPANLLKDPNSHLTALVNASADKEELIDMANGR